MVDRFWLFERVTGPLTAVGAAACLTGLCVLCARIPDRLVACTAAAAAGFAVGLWLAWFARRNSRP
jgi:hypothetical protein